VVPSSQAPVAVKKRQLQLQPLASCPTDQFLYTANNRCYYLPRTCPPGAVPNPSVGCQCGQGQIYNGATGECQISSLQMTCPSGQFFDTISNNCYPLPQVCPVGAVYDPALGCRCWQDQVYSAATGQCQQINPQRPCPNGYYLDLSNNNCYSLPSVCPPNSAPDLDLGCRCPSGLMYNGGTGQC
ncbi:hypothetical protein EGW08_007438, partial [Elysia chlorotica]